MKLSRPAALIASALALTACGSTAATSAGGSNSGARSGAGVSTAAGYHPVTDYIGYVGGHAGPADAKLSPVDIGVINQQGGSADIAPEWTVGATVAADYLNKHAGGIDGHPIRLVTCFIPDAVANAAQCSQQMANNPDVQAISIGPVAIGSEAMETAIEASGKVMVFGISVSTTDSVTKNGYILFGDGRHVEAPIATFAKQYLHAKKVSTVYENVQGNSVGASIIAGALKYEGVSVDIVGYDPSTTDLTAPIVASGAATANLFIADAPSGQACSGMYQAIRKLNLTTPVLANSPRDDGDGAG